VGRIEPTALQKALKDAQHKAEQVALLKQAVVYGTLYVASSMLRVAQGRQVSKH
jgi:hypothetical protein